MKNFPFILVISILILTVNIAQWICIIGMHSNEENHEIINLDNKLVFSTPSNVQNIQWTITANAGRAYDKLSPYCNSIQCQIPLVFGGPQQLSLIRKNSTFFTYSYETGPNRIFCFGGDWQRRICRFHDICFDNYSLTFLSPYPIETENPFIILGARTPPYDKKKDRQGSLKINITKKKTIPNDRTYHKNTSFYASMYYNSQMLWHFLYDFALPLFHTMTIFGLENEKQDILIPPNNNKPIRPFKGITDSFTNHIWYMKANECYRDLIVGISKVKDFKGTQYQFPTNFTQKLIPLIFKQFNLSENNETTNSIVFINRKNSRKIVNSKEIIETIRKQFPQYTINEYYFENMPMKEQIRVSSNAKILIGAHGSGISHLAWMKPNSTVIEIFPYLYICRNWYKKASVVSAVNYLEYHPVFESESFNTTEKQLDCFDVDNICGSDCEEILKSQDINLKVDRFIKFLKSYL